MSGSADAAAALLADLAGLSLAADARQAADAALAAPETAAGATQDGVSLAALRAFAAEHSGRRFDLGGASLPFEELTTEQVVDAIIKPATRDAGVDEAPGTYAQLLQRRGARDVCGAPHVAPATLFVSHAWLYLFVDLLTALEGHAAQPGAEDAGDAATGGPPVPERATPYYWLDVMTCSQHTAAPAAVSPDWWSHTFRDSVASIGATVLVLQPWRAPVPLTRAWCLWEVFCTVDTGATLEVALGPHERAKLEDALTHRFEDIALALSRIDTRRAVAKFPEDEERIKAVVHASADGFGGVNSRIHGSLQRWLRHAAAELVERRCATLGETHADTLACADSYIALLGHQGRMEEAAEVSEWALELRRAKLGEDHPATLSAAHFLGMNLWIMEAYDEAEPLLRDTLARRARVLGEEHRDTHMTRKYLGILAHYTGRLEEAEVLLRAAAGGHEALLGAAHPDTLASRLNLGILLRDTADGEAALAESEVLLRQVLLARREVLGRLHPQTLDACFHFAVSLIERGALAEAEALLVESYDGRLETLGESHHRTVQSAELLADVREQMREQSDE
jgi:hypothetical protein